MMLDPLELVATGFGLACVWLAVKRNLWTWPTGLVMVSLYIVIFGRAKLYSDMGLQVIYVGLQAYGWWHWLRGGEDQGTELRVGRLSWAARIGWGLVCGVGTAALGWVMSEHTDAALPFPDAATTVTSLVAQWLMARKVLENWSFWIAVDVLAIAIYLAKGLYPTAILYAVFLGMCIVGYRDWKRAVQTGEEPTDELPTGRGMEAPA